MTETIRQFVEKEKSALVGDCESIAEAVRTRAIRGTRVAVGLLALDRPAEAVEWFEALAPEWVRYADAMADHTFDKKGVGAARRNPWYEYQRGLQTAFLGCVDPEPLADRAFDAFTRPIVEKLEHRDTEPRIDLVGMLSGYFAAPEDRERYRRELRRRAEATDDAYHRAYYVPQADALAAIESADVDEVERQLAALLDFHEEFVIGAADTTVVDEAVAFEASVYLAWARREGLDPRVDSEYVPEAVYDEEYYPLGGA